MALDAFVFFVHFNDVLISKHVIWTQYRYFSCEPAVSILISSLFLPERRPHITTTFEFCNRQHKTVHPTRRPSINSEEILASPITSNQPFDTVTYKHLKLTTICCVL